MPLIEAIKERVEKLTGSRRPSWPEVEAAIRRRKPQCFGFIDDGVVPNSHLPLVIYRGAVRLMGLPIALPFSKFFSPITAGKVRGATAFTISGTIIRGPMRRSGSPTARPRFVSGARERV